MEYLDIVNENDRVVSRVSMREVYQNLLLHRIVHVFCFNTKGEVALQLRSRTKKFCPLHWTSTAGGHVQSGETYHQAGERELREEAGRNATLEFVAKDLYHDTTHQIGLKKFITTYKSKLQETSFTTNSEVDRIEYLSLDKIRAMMERGEKFHPECAFPLQKYFL